MGISLREQRLNALVLDHLGMVKPIALGVRDTLPRHIDLDDLVSEGVAGLYSAAQHFDPNRTAVFGTYAKYRIRGAMLDYLRKLDHMGRDGRRELRAMSHASEELESQFSRSPTEDELAIRLGISLEQLRKRFVAVPRLKLISTGSANDEREFPPIDPASPAPCPDQLTDRERKRAMLADALEKLPPMWATVMQLYFFEELTMKEAGLIVGVNESRVSQIVKAALTQCRDTLMIRGLRRYVDAA